MRDIIHIPGSGSWSATVIAENNNYVLAKPKGMYGLILVPQTSMEGDMVHFQKLSTIEYFHTKYQFINGSII